MQTTELIAAEEDPIRAADNLVAAIKRVGQLGRLAGGQFASTAENLAGDVDFEEGMNWVNA
jgi:hypothetical protein